MRRLVSYAIALFLSFGAAEAAELPITLDFDSSNSPDQQMVNALQGRGKLPLPLVTIGGKVVGLVPGVVYLSTDSGTTRIDIGVTQIIDQTLYTIQLVRQETGAFTTTITYPAITEPSPDQLAAAGQPALRLGPAVVAAGPTVSGPDQTIALPLVPYATLAQFVSLNNRDLRNDRQIPVVHTTGTLKNVALYPEFTEGSKEPYAFYSYRAYGSVAATPELLDHYETHFDSDWVATIWHNPLEIPRAEPLELRSIPDKAAVFVNGASQDEETETVVRAPHDLWSTIVLRKAAYRDCVVAVDKIATSANSDEPPTFTCRLQRR